MPAVHHIKAMRVALFLAVLLFASPALAGKTDPTWNPPARFDHAYSGKLTVRYMPQKQVVTECGKLFEKYGVPVKPFPDNRGCSVITSETTCTVISVDKPFKLATPQAVVRHEVGHCNGWPADHPD